ncbi:MAG: hypothetical protein DSY43_01730, partial [Gammaproteobacteria bacterium]
RNTDIHGISFHKTSEEIKLVLFADDATFCLKDVQSLVKSLEILEQFKKYSSLKLNLEKSEVGWIGPPRNETLLPADIKKKIDLHCEGIKILGIYFSHNKEFLRNNNFDRVFEKFKSTLNIWRMRNLTLFGKAVVVRSLAISQLLYVFSKTSFPHSYVKKVKDEILKFLWNGKKSKVKYTTLIGEFNQGGIRLPDFESIIKANRASWAIKLMNTMDGYWKSFAKMHFHSIGGINILGENFDSSILTTLHNFPKFYTEILEGWTEVSSTIVLSVDDILRQPIWFNKYIKLNTDVAMIRKLIEKGIKLIHHVWEQGNLPNWNSIKIKGWMDSEYLIWRSIIDAIPAEWRVQLKLGIDQSSNLDISVKYMEISNKLTPVNKVNAKMIYWKLTKRKFKKATSQRSIAEKLGETDIEWSSVYSRIYQSTIDTKLRAFQYKILNNCLYLNQKLFLFKLVESPNCTFCFHHIESIEHFFLECLETRNFYIKCRIWLKSLHVNLPDLNFKNVLLGYDGNNFEIFLFLLFKFNLYNSRIKGKCPILSDFQSTVKNYEKLEYVIAVKKSRLTSHLKKYEKIRTILETTDLSPNK